MNDNNPETIFSINERIECLKERKRLLEKEVERLKLIRNEKQQQIDSFENSNRQFDDMLKLCSGIEAVYMHDNEIFLRFHPMYKGKAQANYCLQLNKVMGSWTAPYCDMPLPCMNISTSLNLKNVHTVAELWLFIYLAWHQVTLFIHRREQFQEAQEAFHTFASIYPSVDTLKAGMDIIVRDVKEDAQMSVKVTLKYNPQRALPDEISLQFQGATQEARTQCEKELRVLKHCTLKEALSKAFVLNNHEDYLKNQEPDASVPERKSHKMQGIKSLSKAKNTGRKVSANKKKKFPV